MTEEQLDNLKGKKYVRTTMFVDGTYVSARLNLSTGEIKPHKYKTGKEMPKVRWNGIEDGNPPWTRIPAPVWVDSRPNSTKANIRKTKSNPNNIYLEPFMTLTDATDQHPVLDDLFTGVSLLGNAARDPVNKGILFCMLRDLDEINVKTIQEYTRYSEDHCYKLAMCLRVLSNAFDNEVDS